MLPANLPDIDALWDYNNPARTEMKFREILLQVPENEPAFLELLTQIARAQGLQHKFENAHQTLNQVERRLGNIPSRQRIRYLLERGRVFNSSGQPEKASLLFEQALSLAEKISEDFYAIDAIHMLAIVSQPEQSLDLNLRAVECAEQARDEKARNWLGSLYNNLAWSYHDLGNYELALETFVKEEAWQISKGKINEMRIAAWCIARTLRSMNRFEEALSRQMQLKKDFDTAGEKDGYVLEEIGECLLALNRRGEARPYFSAAYETLSQDVSLVVNDPHRLARLKTLADPSG
jgi:tetratricopeptide (TPR) repeat protein